MRELFLVLNKFRGTSIVKWCLLLGELWVFLRKGLRKEISNQGNWMPAEST